MKCSDINESLTPYLLGDLDAAQDDRVRAHLAECATCRTEAQALEQTLGLLREAMSDRSAMPERLHEARKAQVCQSEAAPIPGDGAPPRRLIHWKMPNLHLAEIAAVLVIGLLLAGLFLPNLGRSRESARRVNTLSNMNGVFKAAAAWGLDPRDSFRPPFPPDFIEALAAENGVSKDMLVSTTTRQPFEYYGAGLGAGDGDKALVVSREKDGCYIVKASGAGMWIPKGEPLPIPEGVKPQILDPAKFEAARMAAKQHRSAPQAPMQVASVKTEKQAAKDSAAQIVNLRQIEAGKKEGAKDPWTSSPSGSELVGSGYMKAYPAKSPAESPPADTAQDHEKLAAGEKNDVATSIREGSVFSAAIQAGPEGRQMKTKAPAGEKPQDVSESHADKRSVPSAELVEQHPGATVKFRGYSQPDAPTSAGTSADAQHEESTLVQGKFDIAGRAMGRDGSPSRPSVREPPGTAGGVEKAASASGPMVVASAARKSSGAFSDRNAESDAKQEADALNERLRDMGHTLASPDAVAKEEMTGTSKASFAAPSGASPLPRGMESMAIEARSKETDAAELQRLAGVREFQKGWEVNTSGVGSSGGGSGGTGLVRDKTVATEAPVPATPPLASVAKAAAEETDSAQDDGDEVKVVSGMVVAQAPAAPPLPFAGKSADRSVSAASSHSTVRAKGGAPMPLHEEGKARMAADLEKTMDTSDNQSQQQIDAKAYPGPAAEPKSAINAAATTNTTLSVTQPALTAEPATPPVFKPAGFNPWIATATNTFSTFAMDVDTASYTLSRNYMLKGARPPPEAVRTEEFLNFFDYQYTAPAQDLFAIHTTCAPTPFSDGALTLRIGVKSRHLGREKQQAAALTFVIDTSGSMNTPDRLTLAKQALTLLVEKLDPHDRVALVQCESHARLALDFTPVAEKARILAAIEALQPSGFTYIEEGLRLGYETASRGFQSGAANTVLLLSDGVANVGTSAAEDILKKVEAARQQGIFCSVFGFGLGTYDDTFLETLANKGNGAYRFIDSLAEAQRVMVDEMAATLNVVAADAKIQVEFNPRRVKQFRQLGYENRQLKKEEFRNDAVDAGEVGSGQAVTALYELTPQGDAREPLGTVRVRYRNLENGRIEEIEKPLTAADCVASFERTDRRFQLAVAVAEFAELLRGSPYAEGGDCEAVAKVLRPVALELHLDQRVQELLRLVHAADDLPHAE